MIVQATGIAYIGEQLMTASTAVRADGVQLPVIVLLPKERLYALADTSADVRVMEHGLQ